MKSTYCCSDPSRRSLEDHEIFLESMIKEIFLFSILHKLKEKQKQTRPTIARFKLLGCCASSCSQHILTGFETARALTKSFFGVRQKFRNRPPAKYLPHFPVVCV